MTLGLRVLAALRRRERTVLALLGAVTVALGVAASRLEVRTDFEDLYPDDHPDVRLHRAHRDVIGVANVLLIVVRAREGTIYGVETIAKIDRITRRLLETPGVDPTQVGSLTHPRAKRLRIGRAGIAVEPVVPALPRSAEDVERIREAVRASEGVRGVYVADDGSAAVIRAGVWESGVDASAFFRRIEQIRRDEEDATHEILATGPPMLSAWIAESSRTAPIVVSASVLAIAILLFAALGSTTATAIALVSGLSSAVWAIGATVLCGFALDPLALVVFVLLAARALSHSVQSVERYHEELERRGDAERAIRASYGALFRPALVAVASDGLAVLALALTTIPVVVRIGWVSAFWILSIAATVVVLHPLVLLRFGRGRSGGGWMRRSFSRGGDVLARVVVARSRAAILVVAGAVAAGALVVAARLEIGDVAPGAALYDPAHPYNRALRLVNDRFAGTADLVVVAEERVEGALRTRRALEELEALEGELATMPGAGGSLTIAALVRRAHRVHHEGEPRWEFLPRDPDHVGQILFLLQAGAGRGELDRLLSADLRRATVSVTFRDPSPETTRGAVDLAERFAAARADGPLELHVAGGLVALLAATQEELVRSRRVSLVAILAVVFVLSALAYRSALAAVVVMLPSLIAQPVAEAFMAVAGIEANVSSLPVAAVGIGIGIDYAYYLLSRILDEVPEDGDLDAAIARALRSAGRATLLTATILLVSVAPWWFFPMKFVAEMALLLTLVLLLHAAGALLVVPAVVSLLRPRFAFRGR